jgi:hypothetical protein
MTNNHLTLWNAVVTTDPAYTKSFTRGGGFKGTAINFVYLARKATEAFGPMGMGWGAVVLDEKYQPGAPIAANPDGSIVYAITHVLRIKLWYVLGEQRGEIESYGQTTYVGKNSNGTFTDEEAPKKSMTDAMSKALSWLGFGADVHLGLFDDNKYVNDRRREFGDGKEAVVSEAPAKPAVDREHLLKQVEAIASEEAWQKLKAEAFTACQSAGDAEAWVAIKEALAAKAKLLKKPQAKAKSNGNGAAHAH